MSARREKSTVSLTIKGEHRYVDLGASQARRRLKGHEFGVCKVDGSEKSSSRQERYDGN
jgi:hypothetical protein